jgi:hypothetical protein
MPLGKLGVVVIGTVATDDPAPPLGNTEGAAPAVAAGNVLDGVDDASDSLSGEQPDVIAQAHATPSIARVEAIFVAMTLLPTVNETHWRGSTLSRIANWK